MAVTGSSFSFHRPVVEPELEVDLDSDKVRKLFLQMKSVNVDQISKSFSSKSNVPEELKKCSHVLGMHRQGSKTSCSSLSKTICSLPNERQILCNNEN